LGKNDKKIKELEEQIRQLTQQLESLIREKDINNHTGNVSEYSEAEFQQQTSPITPSISETTQPSPYNPLLSRVKSAMKINSKEDLEQKIGSVWASQ